MSRFLRSRDYLTGRHDVSTPFVERLTIPEDPTTVPGSQTMLPNGERLFSDGEEWVGDLPPESEIFIPPWRDVPEGWFQVGGITGIPGARKLIGNKFTSNYTETDVIAAIIAEPSTTYTDEAGTNPVSAATSPVGFATDVSGNGRDFTQGVSSHRMTLVEYQRDGLTKTGIISEDGMQTISIPIEFGAEGSMLVFFGNSAIYLRTRFDGNPVTLRSRGNPIEELLVFGRALTLGEINSLTTTISNERGRQPLNNYGDEQYMDFAFRDWDFITDFPFIDTSNVISFTHCWRGCASLESFPFINTSQGTNFIFAFSHNPSLQSFPDLNLRKAVSISHAWTRNYAMTSFAPQQFPAAINAKHAWRDCTALNFVSQLTNLPLVVELEGAWWGCSSLNGFPGLSFPSCQNFFETWAYCSGLNNFGQISAPVAQNFHSAWRGCSNLTSFPSIDFSSMPDEVPDRTDGFDGNGFAYAWLGCSSLATFPAGVFDNCASRNFHRAFEACALTQQSVDNVLVSIATAQATFGTTGGYLDIDGGTSAAPSATGEAAVTQLRNAGWEVNVNGGF